MDSNKIIEIDARLRTLQDRVSEDNKEILQFLNAILNKLENKVEITDFAQSQGIEILSYNGSVGYYVRLDGCELLEGEKLISAYGVSALSFDDAMQSYCKVISGKTITQNSFSKSKRRDMQCPNLIHTKLL